MHEGTVFSVEVFFETLGAGAILLIFLKVLLDFVQHPSDRFLGWWTTRRILKAMENHDVLPIEDAIKHIAYLADKKPFSESDAWYLLKKLAYSPYGVEQAIRSLASKEILQRELRHRLIPPHEFVFYMTRGARKAYRDELNSRAKDLEPERRDVSAELEALIPNVRDPQEAVFLAETMKCLHADANRAAIVMAWSLAFHHIRRWILVKHLREFNGQLNAFFPKKFVPTTSHDDFPAKESTTLEVCRAAGFLDKSRKGLLDSSLSDRNRYAHPSPAIGTGPEASGYISKLLKNILLDPYFDS